MNSKTNTILTPVQNKMNSPNLTFQPIPYNSTQEAINALSAGEVDCIFPVYFSTYDADERGNPPDGSRHGNGKKALELIYESEGKMTGQ